MALAKAPGKFVKGESVVVKGKGVGVVKHEFGGEDIGWVRVELSGDRVLEVKADELSKPAKDARPIKDAPSESPFARDTDAGSAMLVLADRNNGLNAKQIAAKYGFDIQFVLDVGNGKYGKTKSTIKKALEPVGDSDGIAFSVEDDKGRTLGGPYAARPKAESSLKELQQRLPKSKLKVVPVIAFGRGVQPVGDEFEEANHPRAKNGEFGKGGGRGMAEARKRFPESFKKPTKSFAELRREQAVAEGRADEPYETENSLANRRKKAKDEVQPVGDAEGTHKVSYKLNGPTAFEVNSQQFIDWAHKNKKPVTDFHTRLKALQEFTGDPRIKDWET